MIIVSVIIGILVFALAFIILMRRVISVLDHYEMLSIAVQDYLLDDYNFDISHYQDITEEEILSYIRMLSEEQKRNLQCKCNDNTEFIFDE